MITCKKLRVGMLLRRDTLYPVIGYLIVGVSKPDHHGYSVITCLLTLGQVNTYSVRPNDVWSVKII